MLNREELKKIAVMNKEDAFFISLYLNVDPMINVKNDYIIHAKNMIKDNIKSFDKNTLKKIQEDLMKIDNYLFANKRIFKKGLAILSSQEINFWKEFHLSIPVKNEVTIDNKPYIKPLFDILDNYQRYAILIVGRDSARLFIIHLDEIEEYTEVHTDDVPGRHKKGGWFSLSGKSYERHIDYHVELHLKDVIKQLVLFMSRENVGRLIIGGAEEVIAKLKSMLPNNIAEKIIGTFQIEMFANKKDVLEKVKPILNNFEINKEEQTIDELITKAMKNENAVIGIDDVLNALQEGRIMKLIFSKDYKQSGVNCANCGYLTTQNISLCPYCKGKPKKINYIIDLIAQKAIEQGAIVEVASNKRLKNNGDIGAFLRF